MLFLILVAILILGLFYGKDVLTGAIVQEGSRYERLVSCIEQGKDLNACRLELGTVSLNEFNPEIPDNQNNQARIDHLIDVSPPADDYVPPPFTPMSVEQQDQNVMVSVWGRSYQFREGPVPTQIISQEQSLFARPPLYRLTINNQETPITWSAPEMLMQARSAAVLHTRGTAGVVQIEAYTRIEYDGMIKVDYTFSAPEGTVINQFAYEWRLPEVIGQYFNHHIEYDFQYLNVNKDAVGSSAGLIPENKELVFTPTIWMGNREVGLEWWTETDANWTYSGSTPEQPGSKPIVLAKSGNEAVFRVQPLASSLTFSAAQQHWSDTFALFPAPMRPMRENWRNMRILNPGHIHQYFKENRQAGSNLLSIVQPGSSYFRPQWNGLLTPSRIPAVQQQVREHFTKVQEQTAHIRRDIRRDIPIFIHYSMLTMAPMLHPKTQEKFEEWSADSQWHHANRQQVQVLQASNPEYQPDQRVSYFVCAGRKDYFDWFVDEIVNGLKNNEYYKGIYFDFGSISRMCTNSPRLAGKERWKQSWEYFNIREFYKKLYERLRREAPDAYVLSHTHGQPRAVSAFLDHMIIGETLNAVFCKERPKSKCYGSPENVINYQPDYISAFPQGWFEGMFLPQFGGSTTLLPQIDWVFNGIGENIELKERGMKFQRGMHAITLVNDVAILIGALDIDFARELYRTIDRFFGNLGSSQFYPWWTNKEIIKRTDQLKVSAYVKQNENKILVIIANFELHPVTGTLNFKLQDLGATPTKYLDIENPQAGDTPLDRGDSLTVTVQGKDFRILLLTP